MSITQTELVTLNGNTTAFGGRIYNASYQIGFNQAPSSVTLSIVNESGNYNVEKDDLSVLGAPDTISFGGKNLKMFPVEISTEEGESGKILTVEYYDQSLVYLDKKFVLLNGTHIASDVNNKQSCGIIVGRKYWSFTFELEGQTFSGLQTTEPNNRDLGQSYYKISDLYNAMVAHNIPMDSSVRNVMVNKETNYLNNTVGTLRSVLSAWGNIMAFTFYWGEDNKLHIMDLNNTINVDLEKLENIIPFSQETSYSIKDTLNQGSAVYFGKPGFIETLGGETGVNLSSFYFRRGIQNLDSQTELSYPAKNILTMIKVAAAGEGFFTAYTLALTLFFPEKNYGNLFGLSEIKRLDLRNLQNIPDSERTQYESMFSEAVQDRFSADDYNFVEYKIDRKADYGFSYFNNILNQLLTYEMSIKESDYQKFSTWSRPFTYDYENGTEFINTDNADFSNNSHRAFFTISPEESFSFRDVTGFEQDIFIPIDFTDVEYAESLGFNPQRSYALIRKGVDWETVENIRYKYINKKKYHVRGFVPYTIPAFQNSIPRFENIQSSIPSMNTNTIATNMQIDSTDLKDAIPLLAQPFLREEKTFRKTFSINGISLPENITPEDGLQSISISNSNQKGTTSTYVVGNSFFKIPSTDILLQQLRTEKYAQYAKLPRRNTAILAGGGGAFSINIS